MQGYPKGDALDAERVHKLLEEVLAFIAACQKSDKTVWM